MRSVTARLRPVALGARRSSVVRALGVAQRSSSSRAGATASRADHAPAEHFGLGAFGLAVGCGTVKDASCDVLVQSTSGDRPLADLDWRRVSIFASFGACFVGGWQYMLFTVWMQRMVPMASFVRKPLAEKLKDRRGLRGVAIYVLVENALNQPFGHFPVLYAIKHRIEHACSGAGACIEAGVQRARSSFVEDNLASCAVWIPATLVNALFAPPWARVPAMTAMGVGWTSFMSWRRGPPDPDAD